MQLSGAQCSPIVQLASDLNKLCAVSYSSSVTTATDPVTFRIGTGGRAEVYSFDLTRKLRMAIQIQVRCPIPQYDAPCCITYLCTLLMPAFKSC